MLERYQAEVTQVQLGRLDADKIKPKGDKPTDMHAIESERATSKRVFAM